VTQTEILHFAGNAVHDQSGFSGQDSDDNSLRCSDAKVRLP